MASLSAKSIISSEPNYSCIGSLKYENEIKLSI